MAGDWIKMRGNLWDDPRVAKLCDLTDQGEAAIVGGLYWLWATADQHSADGTMPGLSLRQIDRKTGIQGFGQALCDIGWISESDEGIQIVRFEEHNGASAKSRAMTAKRVANHKERTANAEVTVTPLAESQETVSGALPREREEKSNSVPNGTGAASAAPAVDNSTAETPEEQDKRELYEAGKSLLQRRGMPKPQCGAYITKLSKDYGQAVALEAVRSGVAAQPLDAAEYLRATCQRLKGERKDPATVPSTAADETKRYLAEQAQRGAVPPPVALMARLKRQPEEV